MEKALIADAPSSTRTATSSGGTPTKPRSHPDDRSPFTPATTVGDSSVSSDGDFSPAPHPIASPEPGSGVSLQSLENGLQREDIAGHAAGHQQQHSQHLYWEAFFVNMPMFCGYAALFGLQHEIKTKFGISDDNISASRQFGVACSFLFIFNLIFRFSHNIVFGWMGPRGRTYMAMLAMVASMVTIAVPIFIFESFHFAWIMLAYALGGVAVGTFEANFLCCLTPLGPRTKHVAITAIPIGITTVLVGAFIAMGPPFYLSATCIYLAVACGVVCGMVLFSLRIPNIQFETAGAQTSGWRRFAADLKCWREWLPLVWHLPPATAIDMFALSAFSPGVALYIYDQPMVSILPGVSLPNPDFFAVYNTFNMLGGLCGRILSYRLKPRHPLLFTVFNVVGAVLLLLRIPVLAPLSTFLVMMGDGFIYGTIARRIDASVPKQFNLVALSFWLFVGDFGSVIGSNLISYIRVWVVGH
jgi:hypothetical protein